MAFVQPLTLLTSSNTKWTTTQEKSIARDYPFTDIHLETPDQFVARTYLQFLWLPESIMPINLLVPSLQRVQDASPCSSDSPHPLHALLDPLLLSVRSAAAKYHTDLSQILAQDGGEGGTEECMMWYALGYEMNDVGEGDANTNSEDAIVLEEKSRNMWLERLERREAQIQIILYFLKLSLPGPCTPLPPVTILVNDSIPSSRRRSKQRAKVVTPTVQGRLESFMDKLCIWQLVMNSSSERPTKDERDWTQAFCENVVERQFKSTLPDMCTLMRHKLFPYSPFEDEDNGSDTGSSPASQMPGAAHPSQNPKRIFTRSSTFASVSQSKDKQKPKTIQRSSSVLSNTTISESRSRSRSLSVSLAQDASARRSTSTSGTSSSLKRAFSREVSMSRAFKPRVQQSQTNRAECAVRKAPPKTREVHKEDRHRGVTLVAATPTKPKVRGHARNERPSASQRQGCAYSPDPLDVAGIGDDSDDDLPDREDCDELWLPDPSPNVLLFGPRKRAASGSSSSMGLSDPAGEGVDTPVKKRLRR